jgi:hypothetical protein
MSLITEMYQARSRGVPFLAINTQNQPKVIKTLADDESINYDKKTGEAIPVLRWDVIRGIGGVNDAGRQAVSRLGDKTKLNATKNPVAALTMLEKVQKRSLIFLINVHRFIGDPAVSTGICNLRDPFKGAGSSLCLLGPGFDLPAELVTDVVTLEDPLPSDEQLREVVSLVHKTAKMDEPSEDEAGQMVMAMRGLSSFGAEQQAFMSLVANGEGAKVDLDSLWSRKITAVNSIKGLNMEMKPKSRDDIRGLDFILNFFDKRFKKHKSPILHIDEIDKVMAGTGYGRSAGDSSGVASDYLGKLLEAMEDWNWNGIIPVGHPGCGKSHLCKLIAGIHGVPYVRWDMNAMKGKFVGDSEAACRLVLDTIRKLGTPFVLATCNSMDSLPPALRRRFKAGTYFFDLPTAEERADIWTLYLGKFNLTDDPATITWDQDWTGAEIRNCCEVASDLDITVAEARDYITPIAIADRDSIDNLRDLAHGRFLDAANGGFYQKDRAESTADTRQISI